MTVTHEFYVVKMGLERSLRELPPLPTAVTKVLAEMQKSEPNGNHIEHIIGGDQALASKVLRVVNSAYYGLSGQVTNVGQAIIILGLQQVRNIVLSVGSMTAFASRNADQAEETKRFWEHSFGSASTATQIVILKGWERKEVENIFTAGILHDIGRLFLFCNFNSAFKRLQEIALKDGVPVEEVESKYLGTTHARIGGLIAEKWGLPVSLVDVIAGHEGPFESSPEPVASVIHFSDWLNKKVYTPDQDVVISEPDPEVMAWLGLSDSELEEIIAFTQLKVSEASSLYGMVA